MLVQGVRLVLAAGAATTVGFMLYAGEPGNAGWWVGFVPFAAWALAPYLAVEFSLRRLRSYRRSLLVLLAASLLLSLSSAALLWLAFVAEPDAQSGIVFVFLPLWQLVGLVPFGLLATSLRSRAVRDRAGTGRLS